MGDTPTTVNQPAKTVDGIINAVIEDAGVAAASAALKTAVPFLALPGVSQVVDLLLRYFASFLYKGLANFATLQIIQFQTSAEKHEYASAEFALRQAHLSGDPNAIAKATADFKKAFRSLVHFDGSA